jgi:hypothetical protein
MADVLDKAAEADVAAAADNKAGDNALNGSGVCLVIEGEASTSDCLDRGKKKCEATPGDNDSKC